MSSENLNDPWPRLGQGDACLVAFQAACEFGLILDHTGGGGLDFEISESLSSWCVSDHPFEDIPPDADGLYVWEGKVKRVRHFHYDSFGSEYEIDYVGNWRRPDDDEWDKIKKNETLWK